MEQEIRRSEDDHYLDVTHHDIGDDFADHHFQRVHRHGEQIFQGAAFQFAGYCHAGHHDHGHGENGTHQPRHDVVLGDALRVVIALYADFERRRRAVQPGERAGQVVRQHALVEAGQRCQRVAGGGRVGGVRFHQHGGPLAARETTREIGGDGDDELDRAHRHILFGLCDSARVRPHIEVAAVFQRCRKAARIRALIGVQHHRRQVLGVGIDGKAEQHQLHHGNTHHHGKGDAVAPQLDEFLCHDGPQAMQGKRQLH